MSNTTRYGLITLGLVLLLLSAACGGQQATPTVVPTPAGSPTPIPPGMVGNPFRMMVLPVQEMDGQALKAATDALGEALQQKTALAVEVVAVDRYSEALAALCNSTNGLDVAFAWLDGIAYMAASAQNCGMPVLEVKRDTNREVETGASGQIILNSELGTTEVSAIQGRTFCRLGMDDFYSWLLPVLVLREEGIDLLSAPSDVVDYEDVPTLIQAVASGDCAAAGIAEDSFQVYADVLGDDVRENINFALTTIPFPFAVLMYPLEIQLGVRIALNDALIEIANDPTDAETLRLFLGQDSLVRVAQEDFDELKAFMESSGLDFAQLGN